MIDSIPQSLPYIEPRFSHILRFWWAWTWRWCLLWIGCYIAIGLPVNLFIGLFGPSETAVKLIGFFEGMLLGGVSQVFALWYILDKDFADFRIRIEEPQDAEVRQTIADFVAPELRHALKFWWAWFWRNYLIAFGLTLVVVFPLAIVVGVLGLPLSVAETLGRIVGFGASFIASVWVLKWVFRKDFKTFRVRLLKVETLPSLS